MVLTSTRGPNGTDLTETGSYESRTDRRSNVPVQNSDGASAREARSHNRGKCFPLKLAAITPSRTYSSNDTKTHPKHGEDVEIPLHLLFLPHRSELGLVRVMEDNLLTILVNCDSTVLSHFPQVKYASPQLNFLEMQGVFIHSLVLLRVLQIY
jgi:hypothetical protein